MVRRKHAAPSGEITHFDKHIKQLYSSDKILRNSSHYIYGIPNEFVFHNTLIG